LVGGNSEMKRGFFVSSIELDLAEKIAYFDVKFVRTPAKSERDDTVEREKVDVVERRIWKCRDRGQKKSWQGLILLLSGWSNLQVQDWYDAICWSNINTISLISQ
jgi:hypothetical protein